MRIRVKVASSRSDRAALGRGLLLASVAVSMLLALPAAAPAAVRAPTLDWAPCRDLKRFDCATARVPLDYRDPDGSRIRLAVIRHRATKPSRRIGTAFFNPGGPAAAKPLFATVVKGLLPEVRERFDVISWDPRGLGESTAVKCFASQAAEDRFFAGVSSGYTFPVGALQMSVWRQRYSAFGRRCEQRSGALVRHITTAESARDMDLLRRAVGARRVTFLGGSGTFRRHLRQPLPTPPSRHGALRDHRSRRLGEPRPRGAHRPGGLRTHLPAPADRSERAQDARRLPG